MSAEEVGVTLLISAIALVAAVIACWLETEHPAALDAVAERLDMNPASSPEPPERQP